MINKYNTKLLFTDTDSLCYEINGENVYKKIYTNTKSYLI